MTPGLGRRIGVALAIAGSIAFALLAHAALIDRLPASWGALLSLLPLRACCCGCAPRRRTFAAGP